MRRSRAIGHRQPSSAMPAVSDESTEEMQLGRCLISWAPAWVSLCHGRPDASAQCFAIWLTLFLHLQGFPTRRRLRRPERSSWNNTHTQARFSDDDGVARFQRCPPRCSKHARTQPHTRPHARHKQLQAHCPLPFCIVCSSWLWCCLGPLCSLCKAAHGTERAEYALFNADPQSHASISYTTELLVYYLSYAINFCKIAGGLNFTKVDCMCDK